MGNNTSSESPASHPSRRRPPSPETATERAKKMVTDFQSSVQRKFDDDHPAAQLIDTLCAPIFEDDKLRSQRTSSYAYSEDYSEDDSRTISEDDTLDEYDGRRRRKKDSTRSESSSMMSQSDYESDPSKRRSSGHNRDRNDADSRSHSFDSEEDAYPAGSKRNERSVITSHTPDVAPGQLTKPLASSFAKRCYFTKAGIGKSTQHYEGLTLTGNVVLMLAAAMKLKGCPTICDEDLRRVEQTYPNQFSRLPDELLLSSGWRRISKYCHFSNKPVPDGVPFFHSKSRVHANGGYYFLLAAAVGMVRPIDVEPLTRDTLVLLETDFPTQCDAAPSYLIENPDEWTLVDKFCFFSGGPINQEEDVYYQADFDGNPIFMLAFLSPSLTPGELYKLNIEEVEGPGLKSMAAVEEVESVYDLTERDFDDLKLYHLGPCRALPPYILEPSAWRKVLPPHFLSARHEAMLKAQQWEEANAGMPNQTAAPLAVAAAAAAGQHPMHPDQPHPQQPQQPEPPTQMAQKYDQSPMQQTHYDYSPSMPERNGTFVNHDWGHQGPPPPQEQQQQQPQQQLPPQEQQQQQPEPMPSHSMPFDTASNGGYFPRDPYNGGAPAHFNPDEDGFLSPQSNHPGGTPVSSQPGFAYYDGISQDFQGHATAPSEVSAQLSLQREIEEEGAFVDSSIPIDEALALRQMQTTAPTSPSRSLNVPVSPPGYRGNPDMDNQKLDPPEDEPPSLSKHGEGEEEPHEEQPDDHAAYQNEFIDQDQMLPPLGDGMHGPASEVSGHDPNLSEGEYYPEGGEAAYRSPSMTGTEEMAGYPDENRYYESPRSGVDKYGFDQAGSYTPSAAEQSGGEYYISPEKSESSNPAYSGPEGDYYASPTYTEDTGLSTDSVDRRGNFAPIRDENDGGFKLNASPRSEVSRNSSEYTPTSAMRTAQDLLRKNRQRRLEGSTRRQQAQSGGENTHSSTASRGGGGDDSASQGTWDSGSEMTSVISGSSVWTDGSNAADRSSRRALILQMAKARMKSNKPGGSVVQPNDNITSTIAEETSVDSGVDPRQDGIGNDLDETRSDIKTDIDFGADLD